MFEEAAKAGAERICYASSVAAYGFHDDNPDWLTEDDPAARLARAPLLAAEGRGRAGARRRCCCSRRRTVAYVFRPCIVAGPEARTMLQEIPYFRLGEAMPDAVARLLGLDAGRSSR